VLYRLYGFDQDPALARSGRVPQPVAPYGKTWFEDKQ
jgi:hypothetical protein